MIYMDGGLPFGWEGNLNRFRMRGRRISATSGEEEGLQLSQKENMHARSREAAVQGKGESLNSTLTRHEELLLELQKEIKSKVNKHDYLIGLSSKVSLSDITSITMDLGCNESTSKLNQTDSGLLQTIEEQIVTVRKEN